MIHTKYKPRNFVVLLLCEPTQSANKMLIPQKWQTACSADCISKGKCIVILIITHLLLQIIYRLCFLCKNNSTKKICKTKRNWKRRRSKFQKAIFWEILRQCVAMFTRKPRIIFRIPEMPRTQRRHNYGKGYTMPLTIAKKQLRKDTNINTDGFHSLFEM